MKSRNIFCSLMTLAVLTSTAAQSIAGRVEGPGVDHESCAARSTVTYYDVFRAGQLAEVVIQGDGETDLDLYVYDENGNLIASDTDNSDLCVVRFSPKWTGRFRIVVKNLGTVYNRYVLRAN
ncbi:hypothetical protein [Rubinisphaera brasiliensis]|uniref:Peptidase domain protein n=1 Tax=Rubinisphaera brasiliensis (strain ATCC 49424 / DSM 5305 / JCM 21570 / IAM 15109 / NBRC 103401 / IFAM 1448) TaxID=756272 RepID=F0SR46_RUBBR|nr:hypothetical protein [Rubinisphaera brasiliensis]ADY61293.1 hypothetical protein Plabr_3700 [Rubinisphaera brasiliensis DSM 5305]